ncbi:MAG: flagellar biosynthetic protein FliR [Myxococcota bacterium]|jgi:flagellar biosynthetic protein FliR|nr:flagellar biosynthetic protein FliR [Myxococcota bacterium]
MTYDFALEPIVATALSSVRVLAMLVTAPMFREQGLPGRLRTSLALMIAMFMVPPGSESVDWREWSGLEVAGVIAVEMGIGMMIGIVSYYVFVGFWMLGDFVSTQGGLSAARVVDPSSGVSSTALARMFNGFGLIVFLALDGHHELIRLLAITFEELPLGLRSPDLTAYLALAHAGSVIFEIAARLAAPITVAIFVQNVATGVLSKSLQQLNLMVVQLPLHIGIVLLIIGFGAPELIDGLRDMLEMSSSRVLAVVLGEV